MARADGGDGGARATAASRDLVSGHAGPSVSRDPSAPHGIDNDVSTRIVGERVKILFVAADAPGEQSLALTEEFRAIQRSIEASRFRDAFELIPKFSARPGDLPHALLQHQPEIVHVACHGSQDALLMLLGEDGLFPPVVGCDVAPYLRVLRDNVVLVVLNACFSGGQAQELQDTIGITIGMRRTFPDRAAVRFSEAFYEGLAYGRSVRRAFELATLAIGPEQRDVPELFERDGIRASAICFAGQRTSSATSSKGRATWRRRGGAIAAVVMLVAIAWRVSAVLTGASLGEDASPASDGALTAGVSVSLSGSRRGELRNGAEVASGDALQVAVTPAVDAHVYVAYCDRDRRLSIFPGGGIAAPAGKVTYVPPTTGRIILDEAVGPEVLYVIVSRRPLDLADPELDAALSRARSAARAECGEPLVRALGRGKQVLAKNRSPDQPELRAMPLPSPAASSAPYANTEARSRGASSPVRERSPSPPLASLERGGFIRWGATGNISAGGDDQDILVLRYNFTHVPRR